MFLQPLPHLRRVARTDLTEHPAHRIILAAHGISAITGARRVTRPDRAAQRGGRPRPVTAVSAADHAAAAELAEQAGQLLTQLRASSDGDPGELGRRGDAASHDLIAAELQRRFPADAVLSEEADDDMRRLDAERVWIVDPLDGTREFGEGRDDWAVHVALVVGSTVVAAAVALPARAALLSTAQPPPTPPRSPEVRRILVSRTRPPHFVGELAAQLGAELVPMGSAGAKAGAVILGEADAYVHAGGQYEWDSAAPVGVALAAGLHASRLDGSQLAYNRRDVLVPDLLVCRRDIAEHLLRAIAACA